MHSYIIEGSYELVRPHIREFCERTFNITTSANSDFIELTFVQCGVEGALTVRQFHNQKSFTGMRVIVCSFVSMTHEAQNALLKTLEEPNANVCIILAPRSAHALIPTIHSRVTRLPSIQTDTPSVLDTTTDSFLEGTLLTRLSIVEKILSDIEEEKKTKADVVSFIEGLLSTLHSRVPSDWVKLDRVQKVRSMFFDRTQSTKQLLEYIAYTL